MRFTRRLASDFTISRFLVNADTLLKLKLAPGGGAAIRFYPASEDEAGTLPTYQP